MDSKTIQPRLPRRTVLQWFAACAFTNAGTGQEILPSTTGYGTDPNLATVCQPGDVWLLTFSADQRKAVTALADIILPVDEFGPAASTLRVPDFVDEWISAPYLKQQQDRSVILPGLKWLEEEAQKRYQKSFAVLDEKEQTAFCADLWALDGNDPASRKLSRFIETFTSLCIGAYYSTPGGMESDWLRGNYPLTGLCLTT